MSEFSELIKKFDKIRDYMRDFYVYGFKSREQLSKKSLRSYDNEKRRIESYLSPYMSFNQTDSGKNIFISVDSGTIKENPFYKAFKAKSFTKNDITLNFIILDILKIHEKLSLSEITELIDNNYLSHFKSPVILDIATVRNKLNEYVEMGILKAEKQGKKLLFSLSENEISLNGLEEAITFFSEISPVGVIGSFLLDKLKHENEIFSFKHHYIMCALESEILCDLLEAIQSKKKVVMEYQKSGRVIKFNIVPLKILASVQGGRRYLSGFCFNNKEITNFRLDYIKSVEISYVCEDFYYYYETLIEHIKNTWGASLGKSRKPEYFSMTLNISHNERYIINRINREGRYGSLLQISENIYKYEASVYDTMEMMPWIRSFIGRIISIECDNKEVRETFYSDLSVLYDMYEVNNNA